LLNVYEISETTIRLAARRIEELRPKFLMGYSYSMHLLADYLLEAGIRTPELKAVFASTQTLLPSQRREIEMAFGCGVYDLYASREFSLMASECEKHTGYHIQSENVLLEFLKDGEPVSPGETGTIHVTSLNNYAMPFIRYEIGDTGKPSDDRCSCGRGLPLFRSLEGRTTRGFEYFVTGDGSLLFLRDMEKVFGGLPVKTFQIVQEKRDEILVRVVKANGYSEKDTNFIKRNLVWERTGKGHFQQITNVEVEFVKSIPLEKSGKKRYFISRLVE
jgi:phenylacetate-CoA ligase